jgi:hypothetical protein
MTMTTTTMSRETRIRLYDDYQRALSPDATESERAAGFRADMIMVRSCYAVEHYSGHVQEMDIALRGEVNIPECEIRLPDMDWMSWILGGCPEDGSKFRSDIASA